MGLDDEHRLVVSKVEMAPPRGPRSIAIVGAGPAGLIAAEVLSSSGHRVTVFDRMGSAGRKFLMAGRGGLNLTHSEPFERFVTRYGRNAKQLNEAIAAFTPAQLVAWCEGLGQETFVGSSGRVFPKNFKASPVLRAWLSRLSKAGVIMHLRQTWTGWDPTGALRFSGPDGVSHTFAADAVVLAMGGASWPRLGSDGRWADVLSADGVCVSPLRPSNCGVRVLWTPLIKERHAGEPLKRIAVSVNGETRRGEAIITRHGLEGNAIYALSGAIRDGLDAGSAVLMSIDLRPDESAEEVKARLSGYRGRQSMATFLRKALKLTPAAIALLREGSPGALPSDQLERARLIKAVPVKVERLSGLERAISSSGGVDFGAIDQNFMLLQRPGVFVAGEMLDWDAPTGGYLLQAAFATGVAAARGAGEWLQDLDRPTEQTCGSQVN